MLFHIITNNFKNVRHQRKSRMNKSSVLVVKDKHPIALQVLSCATPALETCRLNKLYDDDTFS